MLQSFGSSRKTQVRDHWQIRKKNLMGIRVVAKSAGSKVFTSMDALLYGPALKWPIFQRTQRFAYISLGLNYCSIGSS
jgi:hypothetical protein